MKNQRYLAGFAAVATLLCSGIASAHVVLEQRTAPAGSYYKGVLRVGHGCDGSATRALRVLVPEGVRSAKPMPKTGWKLDIKKVKLAMPYDSHGKTVTEEVSELVWTARTAEAALPDAHYDEFVFQVVLPKTAGPLWFKVVQGCVVGRNERTQVPDSGTATKGLKSPAALLNVEATPAPAPASGSASPHQH